METMRDSAKPTKTNAPGSPLRGPWPNFRARACQILVGGDGSHEWSERRSWQMPEAGGQKYYAAGWRPEPYEPREESWADDSPHVKISNYHVVRNDANGYSYKLQTYVTGKDYKEAWKGEDETVLVTIENGILILKNPEEETGAYLKLPKAADSSFTPVVDRVKSGLFVTVGKKGAKSAPAPLSQDILGTGPVVQMDRAPPLDEELERIGREQAARAAKAK